MKTHELIDLIAMIRKSHPDAERLYMEGGCYGFAKVLRKLVPDMLLLHDQVDGHVYGYWDYYLWDIRGRHWPSEVDSFHDLTILDEKKAAKWTPDVRLEK